MGMERGGGLSSFFSSSVSSSFFSNDVVGASGANRGGDGSEGATPSGVFLPSSIARTGAATGSVSLFSGSSSAISPAKDRVVTSKGVNTNRWKEVESDRRVRLSARAFIGCDKRAFLWRERERKAADSSPSKRIPYIFSRWSVVLFLSTQYTVQPKEFRGRILPLDSVWRSLSICVPLGYCNENNPQRLHHQSQTGFFLKL